MTTSQHYKWFFETTTPVEGHVHAIGRTVTARKTKFQQMEILETLSYGKCLVLDGRIRDVTSDTVRDRDLVIARGSEMTGGHRENVLTELALKPALEQVAAILSNQYLVVYARPDSLIPPERLEVAVRPPGLTARAREVLQARL